MTALLKKVTYYSPQFNSSISKPSSILKSLSHSLAWTSGAIWCSLLSLNVPGLPGLGSPHFSCVPGALSLLPGALTYKAYYAWKNFLKYKGKPLIIDTTAQPTTLNSSASTVYTKTITVAFKENPTSLIKKTEHFNLSEVTCNQITKNTSLVRALGWTTAASLSTFIELWIFYNQISHLALYYKYSAERSKLY